MNQFAIKPSSRLFFINNLTTTLIKLITTCLILLLISACASYHGAAQITSSPAGAQVINVETGEVLGVTPLLLDWKERVGTRQQILIKLNKEGYYQKTEGFWLDMNARNAKKAAETTDQRFVLLINSLYSFYSSTSSS